MFVTIFLKEAPSPQVGGGPAPAAAPHAGRLQVVAPGPDRAEVALDELPERTVGIPAVAAEVLEVDLVVLDPADCEGQVDLQRADVGVDLVCSGEVDAVQPAEDLVPLRDVALVELVVRLDGLPGDAVQLVEARLQLARCDLLVVEDKRAQRALSSKKTSGRRQHTAGRRRSRRPRKRSSGGGL